jgi:PIN domain nuclease of toxin-antitoxin system
MNPILLDTHAAVSAAEGKLRPEAARLVEGAAERGELLLSPISAWEIGMLARKRRLVLSTTVEAYVRVLFSLPGVVIAVLSPSIAAAAAMLPETAGTDPADRILVATASSYGARFITRDRRIREYAKTTAHLRCIAY